MSDGMIAGVPLGPYSPERTLEEQIDEWEPAAKPTCSGCVNARVGFKDGVVVARCVFARAEMPLTRLLRRRNARGFRKACECEHWEPSESSS